MEKPRILNQKEPVLITHFVAGYPDMESSFEVARGLVEGGASILEIQFPFSDPSADGPVIESACRKALEAGFKVAEGFKLVDRIISELKVPVYIMSYGSLLFRMGMKEFVEKAGAIGVTGLIIPDLIPGNDEGLYRIGKETGIEIVPVIVTTVSAERLNEILLEKPVWLYTALRAGITGKYTTLDDSNLNFLNMLRNYSVKVMAGFGIKSSEQIKLLTPHCHASIVGSFILENIDMAIAKDLPLEEAARETVLELLNF